MNIEVSNGDFFDRFSILNIKKKRITDEGKLEFIEKDLNKMRNQIHSQYIYMPVLDSEAYMDLYKVNDELWDIEDRIRQKEDLGEFDEEFIDLSRKIYLKNDLRFRLKNRIDLDTESSIQEQKSHRTCERHDTSV
tara:strand:- start:3322 stop:3726 length:405 start_codon:yes stop_codon:yes gene_type:complete